MSRTLQSFAFVLACAGACAASAQDGQFDPRFGNYLPGRTLHQVLADTRQEAWALALQADGRVLLAGTYMAIRLGASGLPDPAFGNGAFGTEGVFAVQPFGIGTGFLRASAVLVQADGKVLWAGSAEGPDFRNRFVACRTSADGELDPGYGQDGCFDYVVEPGHAADITAAALDRAGRLVVAGSGSFSFGQKIVVARVRTDGTLDTGYGTNGRTVILRFDEVAGGEGYQAAYGLAIDAQGRAIVVGDSGPANVHDFAIARLDADGFPDASFGNGGVRTIDFAGQQQTDTAYQVVVQRSGRILVSGYASYSGTQPGMAVLALTPEGDLDPAFGNLAGRSIVWPVTTSAYAIARGLAVQNDGRIVLAGYADNPASGGAAGQDLVVVRLGADGTGPDTRFGSGGVFMAGFDLGSPGDTGTDDRLHGIALQGNRVLAAGGASDDWPDGWFAAIRLTEDRIFADGAEPPSP
ncbi:MAG TPA: hypothetical protein VF422_11250 [Dokdonella sp.]